MNMRHDNTRLNATQLTDVVDDRVRRAQGGDRAACESIFEEHWAICRRVARRMTGSDQDAEDVVQEAYVKALTHLSQFDHRCAFRSWLLRIVTNCATDHLRRNRRRRILFDITAWSRGESRQVPEPSVSADPSLPLQNLEMRVRLDRALGELSETTRGAFVLFAEAEMTYQEVADTLNIPMGTVMSRIHSARKKLKVIVRSPENAESDDIEVSPQPESTRNEMFEMMRLPHDEIPPLTPGY
jgi:RNA polymerase sigma-70 factor (ECF subfamily)